MATDYDELYAQSDNVCGSPFKELVTFFDDIPPAEKLTILDAGCGQGRDTLMMAKLGHTVHAIDTSQNGIQQILAQAEIQKLDITAEVADVRAYNTKTQFDIVLIDRVLHMLKADERSATLTRYLEMVAKNGFLLLMDIPTNIKPFSLLLEQTKQWNNCLQTKNSLFSQKLS